MHYQLELESVVSGALDSTCLTPEERRYYLQLKTDKRRREWLAGIIAAKRLVRKTIEGIGVRITENEIPIKRSPTGVPFAAVTRSSWPLSITHSGAWAAAAMPEDVRDAFIGVDIEKIEARDPSWLEIAFHPSERAETLDAEGQTRLWTMKEAVLKLLGIGLSTDLRDIRILAETKTLELHGRARRVWEKLGRPAITFDSPALCPGYVLTVAYAAHAHRSLHN